MTKRIMIITLVIAFTAFLAGTALGALLPHSGLHDEGDCTACHNNSATPRLRGWTPSGDTPGALAWWGRPIGGLCGTCHSGGAVGTGLGASDMTTKAAAAAAHGFDATTGTWAYTPESGLTGATVAQENYYTKGLPYAGLVGDGVNSDIDCTSCHNVHNNDLRPFLMKGLVDDSSELCKTCHAGRAISVVGTDNSLAGTGANYSTHPTDLPIADIPPASGGNGIAGFEPTIDGRFGRVSIAPAVKTDTFTLGGKRVDNTVGGNFSCQTCHTVHGDDVLNNLPSEDLLAIPSVTLRPSALCKGCHTGGDLTESVGQGGTSDHPVDAITGLGFYPGGFQVGGVPNEWIGESNHYDSGATVFDPVTFQTPACSSCHDAHGGIEATSLWYGPIPANAQSEWCYSCHFDNGFAPDYHHSCDVNYVDSVIGCAACHGGGTTWSAHNGFWSFRVDVSATNSALCELCHTSTDPTTIIGYPAPIFPSSHNAGGYAGTASHSVDGAASLGNLRRFGFDPAHATILDWIDYAGVVGYVAPHDHDGDGLVNSEWGLGGETLCESCHGILENVGPAASSGSTVTGGYEMNLTLLAYEDDNAGTAAGEDPDRDGVLTGDMFCRACHNFDGADPDTIGDLDGGYVHYPAAHTVETGDFLYSTYGPKPYDRATDSLMTIPNDGTTNCPENSTADGAAPGVFSYPADNNIDCDSCHRAHDGYTDGISGSTGLVIVQDPASITNAKTTACFQCHSVDIMCGY